MDGCNVNRLSGLQRTAQWRKLRGSSDRGGLPGETSCGHPGDPEIWDEGSGGNAGASRTRSGIVCRHSRQSLARVGSVGKERSAGIVLPGVRPIPISGRRVLRVGFATLRKTSRYVQTLR